MEKGCKDLRIFIIQGNIIKKFDTECGFADEKFTGCKVDAIFGGITLDLRETIIKEDAIIEASAIFGGIDILVPENTNIVSKGTAIFGGTNIKKENDDTNKYTITINATCMFGGIDVK